MTDLLMWKADIICLHERCEHRVGTSCAHVDANFFSHEFAIPKGVTFAALKFRCDPTLKANPASSARTAAKFRRLLPYTLVSHGSIWEPVRCSQLDGIPSLAGSSRALRASWCMDISSSAGCNEQDFAFCPFPHRAKQACYYS